MKRTVPFDNMRFATEEDFRNHEGYFNLNVEYKEFMMGTNEWETQISCPETNRPWLKTKIALGLILVHTPKLVYWNIKKPKTLENA